MDVLHRVLRRSKKRPISLGLFFPVPTEEPLDYDALHHMLKYVVKRHLGRCERLFIYPHEIAWSVLLDAFKGETFPLLTITDLINDDAAPMSQRRLFRRQSPTNELPPMPPKDLVFPLPSRHPLRVTELQGLSLGKERFQNLERLEISHHFPDIVVNGRLNPWIFTQPLASHLVLTRLAVPPMPYPAINNPDTPQSVSSVEQLILRGLSATPRETSDEDGSHEHDCAPFFCSLETSRVRALFIDHFDSGSRVWHDFIQSLAFVPNRYPLLTQLKLRKISFHGMSYSFTAILLGAFPALRTLNFSRCSLDAREDLISVLELNPSLCPELKDLRDGDTVIPRDDPLPLRDYMYF